MKRTDRSSSLCPSLPRAPFRLGSTGRTTGALPALYVPGKGLIAADGIRAWLDETHALYPADDPCVSNVQRGLCERLRVKLTSRSRPAHAPLVPPRPTTAGITATPRPSSPSKRAPSAG